MASATVTHIFLESRKGTKLLLLWEGSKVISSSNISVFHLLFRGSENGLLSATGCDFFPVASAVETMGKTPMLK